MGGINDDQIVRSNKIADGKNQSDMYKKILNGTYETRFPWMPDENYYKQMMALNGAGESADPNVRNAYKFLTDPKNKGMLPQDIKDIFYNFMGSIQDEDQKIRAYEVTTGIDLKGLTKMRELSDGSYSKTQRMIMPTGPYAGSKVNGGFNDKTTDKYYGHMAYDIAGDYGSNIYPILDGKIVYFTNSNSSGNGRTVVIEHELPNGTRYFSSYSHLNEVSGLKIGMQVSQRTVIGKMGGSADGKDDKFDPHLHLMVYTKEIAKNSNESPYIKSPRGYVSGDKKTIFENVEGCIYNDYFCITPNYEEDNTDYMKVVFYDPYLIMLTNGEIINLFPYEYIKKGG